MGFYSVYLKIATGGLKSFTARLNKTNNTHNYSVWGKIKPSSLLKATLIDGEVLEVGDTTLSLSGTVDNLTTKITVPNTGRIINITIKNGVITATNLTTTESLVIKGKI